MHRFGWREYAVARAGLFRRVDRDAYPTPTTYLGCGLVAYVGLMDAAELRPGDTVFVSSAAGATGSTAGQIARLKGAARVSGSTGSPAKAACLTEKLGFDAAFDYHDGPIADRLREAAPEGIDVSFEVAAMPIGELAAEAGTTTRTLRYYEEQGQLESGRTAAGYRVYERPRAWRGDGGRHREQRATPPGRREAVCGVVRHRTPSFGYSDLLET
ncbi:MerR family DNA-binding transcriptional regulator [Streptomyces inhibens]|uniref:MerR family DNA-binding transcriptional regulator n=1 Tax=Streptomyces inhibens TaxID=2293571 RepID=UPI001EE69ADC|nr:MerR family DNA-binding transcriptional regulator [Streptomyces inhibens]UKY48061.1 MerR family DNA-binding transcriptional regulator [Streptomyces inhibens]